MVHWCNPRHGNETLCSLKVVPAEYNLFMQADWMRQQSECLVVDNTDVVIFLHNVAINLVINANGLYTLICSVFLLLPGPMPHRFLVRWKYSKQPPFIFKDGQGNLSNNIRNYCSDNTNKSLKVLLPVVPSRLPCDNTGMITISGPYPVSG